MRVPSLISLCLNRAAVAKVNWKGGALLAPVPAALVTCAHGGRSNVLTIAWTGIVNSKPPRCYISVRPERFSYELIQASRQFVIHLAPRGLAAAVDFCGVKSGRDVDKFSALHLSVEPSPVLGLPMLSQCPVAVECRVFEIIPLGSHDLFLADIAGVCVDDAFISPSGKLRLDKADIIGFAHGSYYALGSYLGNLGFSVAKRPAGSKSKKDNNLRPNKN